MCTVSFVFSQNQAILTSNRDEHVNRPMAIKPRVYFQNKRKLIYPKDPQGNGSWFCLNDLGAVGILLNGAHHKHQRLAQYRRSRGIILLEILAAENGINQWEIIDLQGVEPFTLIWYLNGTLLQLTWDGNKKDCHEYNPMENHIWSSVTLYSDEVRAARKSWFQEFTHGKAVLTQPDLLAFHQNTQPHDKENGLVINRNEQMLTQSVTQAVIEENKTELFHFNLLNDTKGKKTILTI